MATRGGKPVLGRVAAEGGDVPDRHPPGEVMDVERPDELLSEGALELWDTLVPTMARSGVLVVSDLPMLVEMVEAVAIAKQYREALQQGIRTGKAIEHSRDGTPYEVDFLGSPVEKRLRSGYVAAMGVAEKLATEYGVTPTARARLGVTQSQAKSLVDALSEGLGED